MGGKCRTPNDNRDGGRNETLEKPNQTCTGKFEKKPFLGQHMGETQ
jgi:hypothetical protein